MLIVFINFKTSTKQHKNMKLSERFKNIDELTVPEQIECISKALTTISNQLTPNSVKRSFEFEILESNIKQGGTFKWLTIDQIKDKIEDGYLLNNIRLGYALIDLKIEKKRGKVRLPYSKEYTTKNVYYISI